MLGIILSWLATVLSLGGQVLINKKKKAAFPVWIASNLTWILVNFLTTFNLANVVMYAVYSLMNIHGLIEWTKKEKENEK